MDRNHILYAAQIVETASCLELYASPLYPYAEALLRAVPRLDRAGEYQLEPIQGYPPRLDRLGTGCPFEPRCSRKVKQCGEENPELREMAPEHYAACWQI